MPPAFVLSQNQTLQTKILKKRFRFVSTFPKNSFFSYPKLFVPDLSLYYGSQSFDLKPDLRLIALFNFQRSSASAVFSRADFGAQSSIYHRSGLLSNPFSKIFQNFFPEPPLPCRFLPALRGNGYLIYHAFLLCQTLFSKFSRFFESPPQFRLKTHAAPAENPAFPAGGNKPEMPPAPLKSSIRSRGYFRFSI